MKHANRSEVLAMRRRLIALFGLPAATAALLVWLGAAPLTAAGDPCYHGFTMPEDTTGSDAQVKLMPCAFAPTVTSVGVGATVTFFNGPDFTHLITGANQSWGSRDVELAPGKTVSYTFDKAGVYPYACALHRGMSGVIIVGDAAAAAAGAKGAASVVDPAGSGLSGTGSSSTTSTTTAATSATQDDATQDDATLRVVAIAGLSGAAGALAGAAVVVIAVRRRPASRKDELPGIA
jgi:plastocyanin